MINTIIKEANNYLDSSEYISSLEVVRNRFSLSTNDLGYVSAVTSSAVLGVIPEEHFIENLSDTGEFDEERATQVFNSVNDLVLKPFKVRLSKILIDNPIPNQVKAVDDSTTTLRQPVPEPSATDHQARLEESLTKAHILSQIENPPRTVIKKYVLEHEPITDPEHLIDDNIDTRPRLEA